MFFVFAADIDMFLCFLKLIEVDMQKWDMTFVTHFPSRYFSNDLLQCNARKWLAFCNYYQNNGSSPSGIYDLSIFLISCFGTLIILHLNYLST